MSIILNDNFTSSTSLGSLFHTSNLTSSTENHSTFNIGSPNDDFIIDLNSTEFSILGSIIINAKSSFIQPNDNEHVQVNVQNMTFYHEEPNDNLTKLFIGSSDTNLNIEVINSSSILNSYSSYLPTDSLPNSLPTTIASATSQLPFSTASIQLSTELTQSLIESTASIASTQSTFTSTTQLSGTTLSSATLSTTTMPRINFTNFIPTTSTSTAIYDLNDPSEDSYSCFSSPEDYDIFTATICAMLLVFGVLYTIYGYRCFKSVLFFTGFLFGTIIIYLICLAENIMPNYGNVGVSLTAGFLFGLITLLVAYVGLFMLGFHLGLLIATASLIVIYLIEPFIAGGWLMPSSGWIIFAIFMTLGLTGACGTLYFQRGCSIIASVLYGSTLSLVCIDYFIENFKLLFWFRDKLKECSSPNDIIKFNDNEYLQSYSPGITKTVSLCTISWVLMALWPVSVMIGLVVQLCWTSKGIGYDNDYNYGVVQSSASRLNGHLNGIRQDQHRIEQKQRKYRYLYQVRTAHGDVISQQYIHSLQKKVCPDDSLTYNSDNSSHLTVIPSESRNTTLSIA